MTPKLLKIRFYFLYWAVILTSESDMSKDCPWQAVCTFLSSWQRPALERENWGRVAGWPQPGKGFQSTNAKRGTGGCSWFLFYFSLSLQLILILSLEKYSPWWHPGLNFQHDMRISCILLPTPVMNCSAQCLHTVLNIYPQGLKYQWGGRARAQETSSAWEIPGQENGKWQLLHVVERKAQDWNSRGTGVQD